jgi:hypothetical protein
MQKSSSSDGAAWGEVMVNVPLVNCDNKRNHGARCVPDGLLSGQHRRKLSIDDESSHPINGSNTNNKIVRKRNINDREEATAADDVKRMKVDGDGQDDNKSRMYQVSAPFGFCLITTRTTARATRLISLPPSPRIFFSAPLSFSLLALVIDSRFTSLGCSRRTAICRRAKR